MNLSALFLLTWAAAASAVSGPTESVRQVDVVFALQQSNEFSFPPTFEAPALDRFNRAQFWTNELDVSAPKLRQALQFGDSISSMETIVYTDMDAPGLPAGWRYTNWSNASLPSAEGLTALRGYVSDGTPPSLGMEGIWGPTYDGALELVALKGQHASGAPAAVQFKRFSTPAVDGLGRATFIGFLQGPGVGIQNDVGLWRSSTASGIDLIAIEGQQAPGLPVGTTFSLIRGTISTSEEGHVGFYGGLSDGVENYKPALWTADVAGNLELVAARGDQAAGLPVGYRFSEFRSPRLGVAGDQLFGAFVDAPSGPTSDLGLWYRGVTDELTLIAIEGQPISGSSGSIVFDDFSSYTEPSPSGHVAFRASLSTADRVTSLGSSVWGGHYSDIDLVAKTGDLSPGLDVPSTFAWFSAPLHNARGDIVFVATTTSPATPTAGSGIWHYDSEGHLELVLAAGHLLDVAPGPDVDLRTVKGFQATDGGLNGHGLLAFTASFTDGTEGVFAIRLYPIPEPSALVLLGSLVIGGLLRGHSCRRRNNSRA